MEKSHNEFEKTLALMVILFTILFAARVVTRVLDCKHGIADPECKKWEVNKE